MTNGIYSDKYSDSIMVDYENKYIFNKNPNIRRIYVLIAKSWRRT